MSLYASQSSFLTLLILGYIIMSFSLRFIVPWPITTVH